MSCQYGPARSVRGLFAATLLAIGASDASLAASKDINVFIDQASLLRLERPASEIVIGNPSIADVAVQSGKVLILTGKSYGETNLIVVDAEGKVIISRRVIVQEPRAGFVTVYKGNAKQTMHCAPYCTTTLAIGDAPAYFDNVASQIRTKQSIGQSSAEGEKQN
jgi:hypothetical protein